ncbi:hypothetical protein [Salinivibrio proteolyticus]|uniref:Uncharacterized protein n=1 Tax=Salinivibrio proteolyticus TaxID=334715 RepID=A0ABY7LCH7_9GAMM|nr:hypothetical protein [Salinivibrio proteolyticus]WBA13861.1 hypothetical protein N7E60_08975 [Salinivibrio proteolyticus]
MTTVKRIEAGQYSVSDGRMIVKRGSGWFVLTAEGGHDFGPLTTLASAKEYVTNGTISLGKHDARSAYGRKQSKKEFNAYLGAEAKNGNPGPLILYLITLIAIGVFFTVIDS